MGDVIGGLVKHRQRHGGDVVEICLYRAVAYKKAHLRSPRWWSHSTRCWRHPVVAWINPPPRRQNQIQLHLPWRPKQQQGVVYPGSSRTGECKHQDQINERTTRSISTSLKYSKRKKIDFGHTKKADGLKSASQKKND